MSDATERNRASAPTAKKLDELYALVDDIEIAMLTTRRADGHLVSRPMAAQKPIQGADFWFVTNVESHKVDELEHDPHVNLGFLKDRTREWVSVSGTATVSRDRRAIRELYQPSWKGWLGDEGGERDGGPDDPRIALILVDAHSAVFLKVDRPRPVVLFEVAKAAATGRPPKIGEQMELGPEELGSRELGSRERGR